MKLFEILVSVEPYARPTPGPCSSVSQSISLCASQYESLPTKRVPIINFPGLTIPMEEYRSPSNCSSATMSS